MPFTEYRCGISSFPEYARDGFLAVGKPHHRVRHERAEDPNSLGIAAGEERSTRRTAHRLRDIEIRKPDSFSRDAVNIRRRKSFRSITAEVTVALIVSVDENNVGRFARLGLKSTAVQHDRRSTQSGRLKKVPSRLFHVPNAPWSFCLIC